MAPIIVAPNHIERSAQPMGLAGSAFVRRSSARGRVNVPRLIDSVMAPQTGDGGLAHVTILLLAGPNR